MTSTRRTDGWTRSLDFPAFLATLESRPYGTSNVPTGAFSGYVPSVSAAVDLARRGWPDGMALVHRMALPLVNRMAPALQPSGGWTFDVAGAAYDVGEYLSGVPECWLDPAREETKPCVSIMLDCFLSAGVSTHALKLRGAAVVALVLALQQAGYAVEVSTAIGADMRASGNRPCWARVMLTDPTGGPLDPDRLLYMLAHPAGTRMLMFTYASLSAEQDVRTYERETYSWQVSAPCPWNATLVIPKMVLYDADWSTDASAAAWVERTFAQLTQTQAQTT